MSSNLKPLFEPKSIALIGASTKELSIGNVIIKNLLHYGFKGPIYPINPKADEVRGIKTYKSILDVPGKVDLVHIVIPPPFVPDEVENCGKIGVKAIIINTAGFKEMGAAGQALEDDFLARAKKYNIRIFGPNCQGIINSDPDIRAYCDFTFTYPEPGYISVVAQSGGVGAVIMQAFYDMGVGMRFYASNGNASDVSIPEIVEYYGNDERTKVIVLYVESLEDPRKFMEIAKRVTAKKPILAMTAGRTNEGAEASRSHIGGLAGSISMDLIFKKTGILGFANQEELCHAAEAFSTQPIPKGNKVGIVTNTGGPSVIAIDELVSCGLQIPQLSERAKGILKETMFESASINNPLDVVATAGAPQFRSALDVMMSEDEVDCIYVNFVTPPFVDCESVAREFAEVRKTAIKPIVCNYMTDKQKWGPTSKILKEGEIPCFDFAETAAKALSALVRYHEIRSAEEGFVKVYDGVRKEPVQRILDAAIRDNRKVLSAAEAYSVLDAYDIPAAPWKITSGIAEAVTAAEELGYPVVIKVDSEQIIHKSDVGGVAVNIRDADEVRAVVRNMQDQIPQKDIKFFVQKHMPQAKELIIGAKVEEGLGHLLMFGLGGIFVEVFKDVVFDIAPITTAEAKRMLQNIKAAPLLSGFRGEKGIDKEKVIELLLRVSQLVTDFPAIKELDLNPVFAYEHQSLAVDARILL